MGRVGHVGLLGVVLRRDLTAVEETLLTLSVEYLGETAPGATLIDLARLLGDLPESLTGRRDLAFISVDDLGDARTHLRLGLGKLLERTLRGMFDGPTTVHVDWETGPGIVLDLSAVFGNTEALPLGDACRGFDEVRVVHGDSPSSALWPVRVLHFGRIAFESDMVLGSALATCGRQ